MYGYAAASAVAGRLAPLISPAPTTNPGGLGAQAAAVGQAGLTGLVSALPGAVQSLASPVAAAATPAQSILDPISGFFDDSVVINVGEAIFGHRGLEHVRRHRRRSAHPARARNLCGVR